ncbi:hypothetical protein [Endozoicomonas sp. 8E]|nr:hypothetical protein [Endozoicomonas sp. 8E]WOG30250.1 hypothetical protein P6910_11590 [Endozoicomonas sp. 8E]
MAWNDRVIETCDPETMNPRLQYTTYIITIKATLKAGLKIY